MQAPSVDDRCALLYTARLILWAKEPEAIVERLSSDTNRVGRLTKKGYWLVQQYMEVLPQLLNDHPLPEAEREADQIVCGRHGWPTMQSLGYVHKLPDVPQKQNGSTR